LKFSTGWKIPVAKLADMLSEKIAPIMPWTATVILLIAALGSIVFLFIRNKNLKPSFFVNLFKSLVNEDEAVVKD